MPDTGEKLMIYGSAEDWQAARTRRVLLFGMSGLGKTHVSSLLREAGGWFHYSVDYRIGTRYMGEHIADNFKREAMRVPLLRELLMTDSVYIASNITFSQPRAALDLSRQARQSATGAGCPLPNTSAGRTSTGWPRSPRCSTRRISSTARSEIYGYDNFVCDSGGSICEVVDPRRPRGPGADGAGRTTC